MRFDLSKDLKTLIKVSQGCRPIEYQRIKNDSTIRKIEKNSNCEWNEREICIVEKYIILQQMKLQQEKGKEVLRYTGYCKIIKRCRAVPIIEKDIIIDVEAPEDYWIYYKERSCNSEV